MQQIGKIFGNLLLDLIFPRFCFGCNKEGSFLCKHCQAQLQFLDKNRRPLCAVNYGQNLVREMVFAFKYDLLKSLDTVLANSIFEYLNQNKINFDRTWIVSFVPIHPKKQAVRGFNQAELLARRFAEKFGLECRATLNKLRNTRPQMQLNKSERLKNLSNCFKAASDVSGKKIILIDDVCTTGTTLNECRNTLLAAGARRVCCLAFAKEL